MPTLRAYAINRSEIPPHRLPALPCFGVVPSPGAKWPRTPTSRRPERHGPAPAQKVLPDPPPPAGNSCPDVSLCTGNCQSHRFRFLFGLRTAPALSTTHARQQEAASTVTAPHRVSNAASVTTWGSSSSWRRHRGRPTHEPEAKGSSTPRQGTGGGRLKPRLYGFPERRGEPFSYVRKITVFR